MAGTANTRGGLGWVILVVALAVPGVLFYNWWSHLKAEREKAVAAKARNRVPDGGVFQSSPNIPLVNPMTPAVSTGIVAATPAAVSTETSSAVPPVAPVLTPVAASVASPAPGVAPAFSSSTATAPPLRRDPTMSPFDQIRLAEIEEGKRRAAEELENMKRTKQVSGRPRKAVVRDPSSMINLQGIVSNPESGFKAIVNDEVLSVGEMIGNTKIKIVKITDLGVTFQYQGKRFSKGVSRD